MLDAIKLPPAFSDLDSMTDWCLDTQNERYEKRLGTGLDELRTIHKKLTDRLPDILDYLDPKGNPVALTGADRNLLNLALSAAATGVAVERLGASSIDNPIDLLRFKPVNF